MNGAYIDIHSHILYEMDDGSASIDESVEMIRALSDAGFSTSYATPHNIPGNDRTKFLSKSKDRINHILEKLKRSNINYQINIGAENYFDASLNVNPEDYFVPLGESDKFLVEIPFVGESLHHIDTLHKTGLTCIIAHVERYFDIVENPDKAYVFKQTGFKLQMNLGSLIGVYGIDIMKVATYLLKKGFIDIVATDIHDIKQANVTLKKGIKRLGALVDDKKLSSLLKDMPYNILNNRYTDNVNKSNYNSSGI
ncbi:MAG: tyrosine-protein phosphatase [bacterium]